MRLLTLADVVRKWAAPYGIRVIEEAGWQTRGKDFPAAGPDVALRHWTAGPTTGIWPSGKVLIGGRADLPGPLCQLSQDRRPADEYDAIHVVAAGIANHAGLGDWNGTSGGNSITVGLEIEWSGPGEAFSAKRQLVSEIAMRALMDFCGANPDDACEHREWANPPGRKIDTNLDGTVLRRRMRELVSVVPPTPGPSEPIPQEEDEMMIIVKGDATNHWWITNGMQKDYIETPEVAGGLVWAGLAKWNNGAPYQVGQAWIDSIPDQRQQVIDEIRKVPGWINMRDVDVPALAAALAPLLDRGATPQDIAKAVIAEIAS